MPLVLVNCTKIHAIDHFNLLIGYILSLLTMVWITRSYKEFGVSYSSYTTQYTIW